MDSTYRANSLTTTQYEFEKPPGDWQPLPSSYNVMSDPRSAHDSCIHFSAQLNMLRLPYDATLLDFPELYVAFDVKSTAGFNNLIRTTDRRREEYPFICKISEIVRDSLGVARWIYYECATSPIIRLEVTTPIHAKIKIVTRDGSIPTAFTLGADPQNPDYQTHAVFTLTPIVWEGRYNNIKTPLKY